MTITTISPLKYIKLTLLYSNFFISQFSTISFVISTVIPQYQPTDMAAGL